MKELIWILIGGFLFLSCNNRNKTIVVEEGLLPDTIPYVELESSDGLRSTNNNECIKTFEALGDTIFGDVLYGMDINQAKNSLRKFQDRLSDNKNHNRDLGFVFADISFMKISIII